MSKANAPRDAREIAPGKGMHARVSPLNTALKDVRGCLGLAAFMKKTHLFGDPGQPPGCSGSVANHSMEHKVQQSLHQE